ncbi:MAG: hypothetical protein ACI9AQ_002382, partial [Dinoroseobacter sp.]
NLDAGRLSWLLGTEVLPAEDPFYLENYEALLRIDFKAARINYPQLFADGR